MFQGPTTEGKTHAEAARTALLVPEPERELHPRFAAKAGLRLDGVPASGDSRNLGSVRNHFSGLQRSIGNQAALRLLSHPSPTVQTKLQINEPGDQYEQEADRVAEQVMRMPEPGANARRELVSESAGTVQRKCCEGSGAKCEHCKEEENGILQRRASNTLTQAEAPPIVHEVLRSPGQPLDAKTRAFMEPRFGCDFGGVRIHLDPEAERSARSVGALAYTVGSHIVGSQEQLAGDKRSGLTLIAHELTHVIQQRESGKRRLERQPPPDIREETRSYIKGSIEFLESSAESFNIELRAKDHTFDDSDFRNRLSHWQQILKKSLGIISSNLGHDPALTTAVNSAYKKAVDAAVAFAVSRLTETTQVNQTTHTIFQRYRDFIDESVLPRGAADKSANELIGTLPVAERQRIKEVTTSIRMSIDDLFSTKSGTTTVSLPPAVTAEFSSGVLAKFRHGLSNVAGTIIPDPLKLNSTVTLALDLEPNGGDYAAYRFTYVEHRSKKGTGRRVVLIEKLGAVGVEGLSTNQIDAARKKFDLHGFTKGVGWDDKSQFKFVLQAVNNIPDTILSLVDGLTFNRAARSATDPKAAGEYSPDTHVITIFDRAFVESLTRFGLPGVGISNETVRDISHEIGHAVDLRPLRQAWQRLQAAQALRTSEFAQFENPPGSGKYSIPSTEIGRWNKLSTAVSAAEKSYTGTRSESGSRYGKDRAGHYEMVESLKGRGSIEFRDAAASDGAKRITDYAEKTWKEFYAESFSLYITDPNLLQRLRPHIYGFFKRHHPMVQRKPTLAVPMNVVPAYVEQTLRSGGHPLDPESRSFFEPRFGRDFSHVRVHADDIAARSAQSMNALAYTVGNNVVFGAGQYTPTTAAGRKLLSHELAHVVQQGGATRSHEGAVGHDSISEADSRTPLRVARQVRTEDVQTLSDDELASEHSNLQNWLLQNPGDSAEHATQASYMAQIEAEIARRSPARARAASRRERLVSAIETGSLASLVSGTGLLGPASSAFLEEFGQGIKDGISEQPQERKARIIERFYNLYYAVGHWGDKFDYSLGLLKGIGLGVWGEVKGIVELIWLLPKLAFRIMQWTLNLPERVLSSAVSGKARSLYEDLSKASDAAVQEIKDFFADPVAGIKKLKSMFEALLSSGLSKAYDIGLQSVNSAFEFLERPFKELGEEIGKIIGSAIFQIVLLIGSDAIGNLITKGASLAAKFIGAALERAAELLRGVAAFFDEVVELLQSLGRTVLNGFEKTTSALGGLLKRAREFFEELLGISEKSAGTAATVTKTALQPTAEAIKAAEMSVTEIVMGKYGHLGVRDLSDLTKAVTTPGVDRLFVIGQGDGAVLLEVDAKLSIQARPVLIRDVSSFETAARTGGLSRLQLLDTAFQSGQITALEYQSLKEAVDAGLVLEEVHGFGSVAGISSELKAAQVTFEPGEQFAHITDILESRASRQLSAEIRAIVPKGAIDRRTGLTIAKQIWQDFETIFGPE